MNRQTELGILFVVFAGVTLFGFHMLVTADVEEIPRTDIEIHGEGSEGVPYADLSPEEQDAFTDELRGDDGDIDGTHFEGVEAVEYGGDTHIITINYYTDETSVERVVGTLIAGVGMILAFFSGILFQQQKSEPYREI